MMTRERYEWIRGWLDGWGAALEDMSKDPGGGDVIHALAMDVAVTMAMELHAEVSPGD